MDIDPFEHWYGPSSIVFGEGCVEKLADTLQEHGAERALLVCGSSATSQAQIIEPIKAGLGDHLVEIFDDATIAKTATTVQQGVDLIETHDIDALVSVGGGSKVDVARAMSVLAAEDKPYADLFAGITDDGQLTLPDLPEPKLPVFAVPTTLSGSEVTCATGMNIEQDESRVVRQGPIIDPKIWPRAIFYDPEIMIHTPRDIIASSAMNGFDHAIEMLYSRNAIPMTDATAMHGIRMLRTALPATVNSTTDLEAMGRAMVGVVLSTYGLIDPKTNPKYSLIHAFGHQIAQRYDIQQGSAHGIVAPHVLRYVFESVDGRRELLADALGQGPGDDGGDAADFVVTQVAEMRDEMGLPTALSEVDAVEPQHFPSLAEAITSDIGTLFGPSELDPTPDEIVTVLEQAW